MKFLKIRWLPFIEGEVEMTKYVLDNRVGFSLIGTQSSSLGWPEQEDSDDEHGKDDLPIGKKALVKRVRQNFLFSWLSLSYRA